VELPELQRASIHKLLSPVRGKPSERTRPHSSRTDRSTRQGFHETTSKMRRAATQQVARIRRLRSFLHRPTSLEYVILVFVSLHL